MGDKWKNKNFIEALKNSFAGIKYVFKTERNLIIQVIFALFALLFAKIFVVSRLEFAVLVIVIGGVLFAELINTIVERVLNLYTQEYNENVKIIKDIASGTVLIMAIVSVIVGIAIFWPKIFK